MSFTIPNKLDAFHEHQAQPDKVDIDILVAALQRDGVLFGCAVTAQGIPDMTVAVAAGAVTIGSVQAAVASGNLTIGTADATNPRFDLLTVNNAGTKAVTAGTAAAAPVFPAIPANSVVLAAVYVPASDTAIQSNQITDKRCIVLDAAPQSARVETPQTTTSTAYTDLPTAGPAITAMITAIGKALVIVTCMQSQSDSAYQQFMSFAVSGATTLAANDAKAYAIKASSSSPNRASAVSLVTDLTAGLNTFTAKYRTSSGANTATFETREITVYPY